MNTYDAALPKGTEPREGHKPRPRSAAPGSGLDAVYASRYTRLEGEVVEGVSLELVVDHDPIEGNARNGEPLDANANGIVDSLEVERVIAEETPPESRRPVTGTTED